ncbi:MAG TPA: hypothetical protein VF719_13325, partial [Abditibacteriaceae bacterium]
MRKILFIAGDLSGDIHSSMLAREIAARHSDWKLFAAGGSHLKAAGANIIADTGDCGVIGFASAMALLPRLMKLHHQVLRWVHAEKPDAIVLCDWGGFNVRLLPSFKEIGIPALYYFPPRSWQKQGPNAVGIVPFVQAIATPFPWSAEKLQAAGANCEWVGHPLLEIVDARAGREELRREFGVGDADKLVALLPGSRNMELKYIAPHLSAVVQLLKKSTPEFSFRFIVAVPSGAKKKIRLYFDETVEIVENRAADVLLACDVAAVKSGTATLEAAVAGAPQSVVYDGPMPGRLQWKLRG